MFSCIMRKNQEDQAMGQIGQPVRRYTVVPLEEPVSPTAEPVMPLPPSKSPSKPPPVTKPEPQPAKAAPHDHGPVAK
jgi:hypothetical protein